MKIESIIRRAQGSTVILGAEKYRFVPSTTDVRHICEVTDEKHIERLLSIKEAFRAATTVQADLLKDQSQPAPADGEGSKQVNDSAANAEPDGADQAEKPKGRGGRKAKAESQPAPADGEGKKAEEQA